ncbi:MAG: MFS transporter [Hyphomicrobiales bacterium]|nr:MFS transporter [Hyphomicrobiales bacterium]
MNDQTLRLDSVAAIPRDKPAWGAVFSMMLGVFGLVTAEFLPASLLTPMAADLRVTEGAAGQAVTATAAMALVASLLIAPATRGLDRRRVLLGFSFLLIVSNLLVAFAPNLPVLLGGRLLLGAALGGFWAMATAVVMRLVPATLIPRALSILFSGVSAATVLAAPVGSYLGDVLGWRDVMLIAAAIGALALVVQFATLPSLAPSGSARLGTLVEVAMRPGIGIALLAAALVFTGHFALFTYVRPYIEIVTHAGINAVSGVLLGFGIANFFGAYFGGMIIARSMRLTRVIMPLAMGIVGLVLSVAGGSIIAVAAMVALWGLAFGAVPVAWSTWLARSIPDEAESGGGLLVASIQLAITLGAALGGVVFDMTGPRGVFGAAGAILVLAALVIGLGVKVREAKAGAV